MKNTLIIIMLLFNANLFAQIELTKTEIIKEYGENYTLKFDKDNNKIFSYSEKNQGRLIYFLKLDNGIEICYQWKTFERISKINEFVRFFNEKFVKQSYMRWKDFETNTIYEISTTKDKKMMIITAYLEI